MSDTSHRVRVLLARAQGEPEVAAKAETEAATAVALAPLFGVVGQARA